MRVYIPATFAMVEQLRDDAAVAPVRGWGFAVTPALRDFFTSGDEDELADVAFTDAARASLRLLTAYEGRFPKRRVVIAADVDAEPYPDGGEAVVRVPGAIPLDAIASVHVDLEQAEKLVAQAIEVVDAADLGDEDAELAVGDALEHELAWYAPQELQMLVELL